MPNEVITIFEAKLNVAFDAGYVNAAVALSLMLNDKLV